MGRTQKMRKISPVRGRRRGRNVVMPPTLRYRSASSSHSRSSKRMCSRLLMRPWLEGLLDRGECSILRWEDRAKKTFSIAWRHASSHGFDQSRHGDLFYMWAHHTGKLTKNNRGDHSNNKSTFRCALHSLKDCIELTQKGDKRGEGAKRTYQFIESGHHQYDRKRKSASKKKNKTPLVDDKSSCCSLELNNPSTNGLDYLSTETNSSSVNVPPSSPDAADFNLEYIAQCSPSNDIKVPASVTSTLSPLETTSYTNDDTYQEQYDPSFPNYVIVAAEVSGQFSETEPNESFSFILPHMNLVDEDPSCFVGCKEEPLTQDNQDQDIKTVDHREAYETTTSIFLPKLNCGGNVKVAKDVQGSHPVIIDCSLIQALLEQQQQKNTGMVSAEMDVTLENADIIVQQEPTTEDSFFITNQSHDSGERVLTELQPLLNDQSFAAMEAEYNLYTPTGSLDHDIFSVGAF